jgi:hypothetical protein
MRLRPAPSLPSVTTLGAVAAVAVLVGSLLPAPTAATDGVSVATPLGVGLDKWVHAASYAVVAGLASAGYVGGRDRWSESKPPRPHAALALALTLVAVVVLVGVFGAVVEAAQSVVPGRTTSGADALANTVGAVVGVVGWWTIRRLRPAATRG